jgi:putative transposase
VRNVLAHIPKGSTSVVTAAPRTIFAQPDREAAGQQLVEVVKAMAPRWPKAAEVVANAERDVLAYLGFPPDHWTRVHSTNPLERLNKEIKRRANVVGVFPDEGSVTRLVGSVLMEIADAWEEGSRYFSHTVPASLRGDSMLKLSEPEALLVVEPKPLRLAPVH